MTVNSNFLENLKKLEVVQLQRPKCRKVKYLISEFGSGTIRIPEYQRSFVWDIPKQCRFIESIFLKVPVPAIFLMERSGDEIGNRNIFEVIDGVQRLTTLCNFFNGSLKLSGLQKLIDLNNTKYSTLPSAIKEYFLECELLTQIIKQETQPEIQFEVFGRLNQGSVSLNAQELRNCMFHGEFNDFLIECSKNEGYRKNIDQFSKFKPPTAGKPDKGRMLDIELVLRFFCLYESFDQEKKRYPESRSEILNDYMRRRMKGDDSNLLPLDELREKFIHASTLVAHVFDGYQFKPFLKKQEEVRFSPTLNQSVFDIQMLGFADLDSDLVKDHKDIIFETFIDMSMYDEDFKDALSRSTNTKVTDRVLGWKDRLQKIFENPQKYVEKIEEKTKLFCENPVCYKSGLSIKRLRECDVFDGHLYHRAHCPGNSIFTPRYYLESKPRATYDSEVIIQICGENDEVFGVVEAISFVLENVREAMENDEFEYHLERLSNLEFIGSRSHLSQICTAKIKRLRPIYPDQDLYFDASGGRNEVLKRLAEIMSLFSSLQPSSIQ
jgi:hypothetical protein